MWPELLN
jgi:hypothetical protein